MFIRMLQNKILNVFESLKMVPIGENLESKADTLPELEGPMV